MSGQSTRIQLRAGLLYEPARQPSGDDAERHHMQQHERDHWDGQETSRATSRPRARSRSVTT